LEGYQEINGVFQYYNNKRVMITGHTGFKGSWLSSMLIELGAKVLGYSLNPIEEEAFFDRLDLSKKMIDYREDINNYNILEKTIIDFCPDIIFHLAAQALVIESYLNPADTWATNLFGTLNLLEIIRVNKISTDIIVITTDKVYKSSGRIVNFTETHPLGGIDPYSSSKAAVEILVASYRDSFFKDENFNVGLSTARSGNVIGGGDWSKDRLVPDFYRALNNKSNFHLRNPGSIRPWQHVLEVNFGYLLLGFYLSIDKSGCSRPWNFGPDSSQTYTSFDVVSILKFITKTKSEITHNSNVSLKFAETKVLQLDSSNVREKFGWTNLLSLKETLQLTNEIYSNWNDVYLYNLVRKQILYYFDLVNSKSKTLKVVR
jgi:CDP-glucose 4,6-dehydratase